MPPRILPHPAYHPPTPGPLTPCHPCRCLGRVLERDTDPSGSQAHSRGASQPQPPGYRALGLGGLGGVGDQESKARGPWGSQHWGDLVGRPGDLGGRARAEPFLAALLGDDGHYVFNGNWVLSAPGTYEVAGTHVVYTRTAGPEETLSATGPTSHDLLLQVHHGVRGRSSGCD